jgi:hypothetical protein
MAKLFNRAKMTTSTTGSGTVTLSSAANGFQSFADAGVSDGDVIQYVIEEGSAWEIGTGTYSASGTSLTRTPSESSNSGAAISLGGTAKVSITTVAADLNRLQNAGSDIVTVSASGAAVTGNITVTGTVDGRDVAADGTKLDGIEANADVTDTANVTAAGALMDSEVTNLAQVKAFSSADYATAAQGTTADAALARSGGTMTGAITFAAGQTFDGRDVSADGSKLDGIESGATADQTITAGSGLTGGGTGNVTISHADTSSQASVNNSGATVIQDVTVDTYGHVTGLGSKTMTLADLGYTGATNANYITNNNQLTNGAGYTTFTANQSLNTTSSPTFSTVTAANFNTTSDATLKTDVSTLTGSLDLVSAMRGVSFGWLSGGPTEVGVIAQEVEAVIPELVSTNDEGIKSVKYGNIVAVLIEAVKELKSEIEELKR